MVLSAIVVAGLFVLYVSVSINEAAIASIRRVRPEYFPSEPSDGSGVLKYLYSLPAGSVVALSALRVSVLSVLLLVTVILVIDQTGMRWTTVVALAAVWVIIAAFVDATAKALAAAYGQKIAVKSAMATRSIIWLLTPVLLAQNFLTRLLLRFAASSGTAIKNITDTGIGLLDVEAGPWDEHEVRMIRGVVQLDKTVAREIMTPRVDMIAVKHDTPILELAERMVEGGHSRIPVYKEDLDHIEGVTYARDVLAYFLQGEVTSPLVAGGFIRPVLFIPESKTLEELLNEFQERRVHMAIVVDEYGGISGLVTIEDLLEEIVGEIQDEFDVGEPEVKMVSDGEFIIDARFSIDQLNKLMNVQVEGDGFDTLGGFINQRLGRIPSQGDEVEYDGLKIKVISIANRRLKRLRVAKKG